MDRVFLAVNEWLTTGSLLAILGSFLWGMISVLFSPCHLAAIPLMVGYVAGQEQSASARHATRYAVAFTGGLFLTIAAVGLLCSLMGWMLGDVGSYWTIIVGAILVWVALDMFGIGACSLSGGAMSRLKVSGLSGAFVLGLAYGTLSGSCTFGFLAPILAIITVQQQILSGMVLIVVFGIGHALPIAVAGSSVPLVRRILENGFFQHGSVWVKRFAGVVIVLLGLFFIARPFLGV
jgi:cytochrome c-type biogenesis protein